MSILVAGEGLVFHYRLINRNRAAGCGAGKRRQLLTLGKARWVTGNSAAIIRYFYRLPTDCYSVEPKRDGR